MTAKIEEVFDCVYELSHTCSRENHYAGLLTIYAAARHFARGGDASSLDSVKARLTRFLHGQAPKVHGAYCSYQSGGNGSAYLYYLGKLPEARHQLLASAEELVRDHVRDADGIFAMPNKERNDMIWIDSAYPVVPFLTWIGLAEDRQDLLDEAADQMRKMYRVLLDPTCGLLHQARGFAEPGRLTEDHWSRGNGWAILALADVLDVLPQDDPRHEAYQTMFRDLVAAAVGYQGKAGMWHQEITDHTSYPEVSGTGLILYGIGLGMRRGMLETSRFESALEKGVLGLMRYVAVDGSIHNCCRGCLAPGQGRIEDYIARGWILNDGHAFGPVMLALSEAMEYGLSLPGIRSEPVSPEVPRREYRSFTL